MRLGRRRHPRRELAGSSHRKRGHKVDEVVYRNKAVRNLVLELQARRGLVAVPKFTASLPGELYVQASSTLSGDPSRPSVTGSFSLEGQKLRETLSWLDADVSVGSGR